MLGAFLMWDWWNRVSVSAGATTAVSGRASHPASSEGWHLTLTPRACLRCGYWRCKSNRRMSAAGEETPEGLQTDAGSTCFVFFLLIILPVRLFVCFAFCGPLGEAQFQEVTTWGKFFYVTSLLSFSLTTCLYLSLSLSFPLFFCCKNR